MFDGAAHYMAVRYSRLTPYCDTAVIQLQQCYAFPHQALRFTVADFPARAVHVEPCTDTMYLHMLSKANND